MTKRSYITTTVEVDVEVRVKDVLEELETDDIVKELERRKSKLQGHTQAWTPPGIAEDLRTAFYARDASRFETILVRTLDQEPVLVPPRSSAVAFLPRFQH